jgi:hypothetical protein
VWWPAPDFPHGLQRAQFSVSAANLIQKNQACQQWEFWGLISHTGFREHSSVVLLLGELSLLSILIKKYILLSLFTE